MCDANDGCPLVLTTCCRELRPKCEVREAVENGEVISVDCCVGFGCAPDAAHYWEKLKARFE